MGFLFSGFGVPLSSSITLEQLQAFALMLHKKLFKLSGKVIALFLENSTAKSYLCNQDGIVSLFLSRLVPTFWIWLTSMVLLFISAYIPTHLNVVLTITGKVGSCFLIQLWQHFNFGVNQRWIYWYPHIPINVSSITPQKINYHWKPWIWTLLTILGHIRWVMCFLLH